MTLTAPHNPPLGKQVYADDDAVPYRVVRPSEKVFPVAGAIAFFLGIPQPFSHKASTKSHVKLLTLSKDDYEDIKDRYPESRDQLIENIKAMVGLLKGDGAYARVHVCMLIHVKQRDPAQPPFHPHQR